MAQESAPPQAGQPLLGFLSNQEWDALIARVNGLVESMESLPEGDLKDQVFRMLDGIDAIHREGLRRLVRLFKEGVLEQVVSDPAIHTLMELYDLLPPDGEPASAVPDPSSAGKARFPVIPIRSLPAGSGGPARYPHWVPVLAQAARLGSGEVREVHADELPLLVARREARWFAVDSACAVDGSALDEATLNGFTLTCPHHAGCHYDIRTGQRLGGGPSLACHPVKVDEQGRVLVGLDMDFEPQLPSF